MWGDKQDTHFWLKGERLWAPGKLGGGATLKGVEASRPLS